MPSGGSSVIPTVIHLSFVAQAVEVGRAAPYRSVVPRPDPGGSRPTGGMHLLGACQTFCPKPGAERLDR